MRRGGVSGTGSGAATTSLRRRVKGRSNSTCSSSGSSSSGESRLGGAFSGQSHHSSRNTYSGGSAAVVAGHEENTLLLQQPPTTAVTVPRCREMDILFDMWAMEPQQQQQEAKESDSIKNMPAKSNSTSRSGLGSNSVSPDSYADLLAMSPNREESSAYIAETLAIHLASMPSRAQLQQQQQQQFLLQQQQQQQVVLQQRPTSVIVASASFGSSTTSVPSAAYGKCVVPRENEELTDEFTPLTVLDNSNSIDGKDAELLREMTLRINPPVVGNNSKKMTTALNPLIAAPTAQLFSRPKAVTDTLFSFNSNSSSQNTTATAKTTAAAVAAATELPAVKELPGKTPRAVAESTTAAVYGKGVLGPFPSSAKEFTMEEDTLLRELFGDMAENGTELEKLSPYIGDVCVILKDPVPSSSSLSGNAASGSGTATTVVPMDIQVIDFGPAGSGFDDIEIPLFGGGEYKVKSEPGLETIVDFKDFPELLSLGGPLSPSQATPLYNNTADGGDGFRRSGMKNTVKYEMMEPQLRGSTEAGLFWTQIQVPINLEFWGGGGWPLSSTGTYKRWPVAGGKILRKLPFLCVKVNKK
jgi:hypothetical protein